MQNTENNCFRPWTEYLIANIKLPSSPNWKGTLWNDLLESAYRNDFGYIVDGDGVIFKVDSMDKVTNVSRLMSWGEVESFGLNNKTRPIFRAAWITNATDQYIQYFSPVGHGMEMFSMLDGFGPDGRTTLPLLPFPMMKTQNDEFIPYAPSVEDLMAEDWIIARWTLSEVRDEVIKKIKLFNKR